MTIDISVPTDQMLLILDGLEIVSERALRHHDINRCDYVQDLHYRITQKLNVMKPEHLMRIDLEQAVTISQGLTELSLLMVAFDHDVVDLLRGLAAVRLAHRFAEAVVDVTSGSRPELEAAGE